MRFTVWNTSADPEEFVPLARAAEQSGWASMCMSEGTFQPATQNEGEVYPFSADGKRTWLPETPSLEPMTMLPVLATHTDRLRLLSFVLKLPLREPLTFAKQVATLALLSHNRFDLGVGMSWMQQEYEFCGLDWTTRRQRFTEAVEVLRLVLSGEMVDYHGEIFSFGPVMARPAPTAPVSIFVGGHRESSLRMAARLGDGWCGIPFPMEQMSHVVSRLHQLLEGEGRDPDDFQIHAGAIDAETIDDFARLDAMGITDCVVMPWMSQMGEVLKGAREVSLSGRIEAVHAFGRNVIEPLATKPTERHERVSETQSPIVRR